MAIKIIKNFKHIKKDNLPLVIGYFGSVHVMHQQLLTKYRNFNILTFTDLVSKKSHQIYNYQFRIENLMRYKPKNIYVLDVRLIKLTGLDFINKFLKPLDPSEILVGEDFKFGSDNVRVKTLRQYFKVTCLNYNKNISTQIVRDLIEKGKIEEANDLSAFNLYYEGKWVGGLKQGRKIGWPTINLKNQWPFLLPEGSYVSLTTIGSKQYKSVSFVGKSKTIKHEVPLIETHILDRHIKDKKFYPIWIKNHIRVEFLKFIRPNSKMKSIEHLKEQIAKDALDAKKYFKQQNI